jgi:hypothetical protein
VPSALVRFAELKIRIFGFEGGSRKTVKIIISVVEKKDVLKCCP